MGRLGPYLVGPNDTPENGIYTGDARELAEAIPDESVDLIFTDPPYNGASLGLYGWLGETAARVLKPGGFCLALAGGLYLDRVMQLMRDRLSFFWLYGIDLTGWAAPVVWPFGNTKVPIVSRLRLVLAYSKGQALPRTGTLGLFKGTGEDKRFHIWGQDETSCRYYLDCFAAPPAVVVDTFCGGGTTPAMCSILGLSWLAFDADSEAADVARHRVAQTQPPLPMPARVQPRLL